MTRTSSVPEHRYCLNCNYIGPMNVHGDCGTCGSQAVVLAEGIKQLGNIDWFASVREAEKIFSLPDYEPDYRDEEGYTDCPAELAYWWGKI